MLSPDLITAPSRDLAVILHDLERAEKRETCHRRRRMLAAKADELRDEIALRNEAPGVVLPAETPWW